MSDMRATAPSFWDAPPGPNADFAPGLMWVMVAVIIACTLFLLAYVPWQMWEAIS